jgi:hypothetical protein
VRTARLTRIVGVAVRCWRRHGTAETAAARSGDGRAIAIAVDPIATAPGTASPHVCLVSSAIVDGQADDVRPDRRGLDVRVVRGEPLHDLTAAGRVVKLGGGLDH